MSKRVKFLADHDHSVRPSVLVAYKKDMELSVPDDHADAAIAAGKAVAASPSTAAASAPSAAKPAAG